MIVSSINRSGSTKYCLDLANKLGLPFYDEVFEYEVEKDHKLYIHEINRDLTHSKEISFLNSIDFKKSVINNHSVNYFVLKNTDVFLSRENVQDSIWSYVAYMDKYFKHYRQPSSVFIPIVLNRMLSKTLYFYEFCTECDVAITIPDLSYKDSKLYRTEYSKYSDKINSIKSKIKLPNFLRYE